MELLEEQLRALDEQHLIPTSERVQLAQALVKELVQALHDSDAWMFDVEETLRHGSLSRGTALRTFDDIDALVLLDVDALRTRDGYERSAEDTIRRMVQTLGEVFALQVERREIAVRGQVHSVGVVLPRHGFRVDLVPAIRDAGQIWIPSRRAGEWIETFPVEAAQRINSIAREKPWIKRAVRLMKGWRSRENVPLSSYALETLVLDRAENSDVLFASLIYGIFQELAEAHGGRRLDLGGPGASTSPVRIADPFSGANLTEGLDARDRMRIIKAGRVAFATLQSLLRSWRHGAPRWLERELVASFTPG